MPELAVQIPEHHRAALVGVALDADLLHALADLVARCAGHREARDVALHVRHEHRHAEAGEALRQHQQRDRLPRAGRARDQAVAVPVLREQ